MSYPKSSINPASSLTSITLYCSKYKCVGGHVGIQYHSSNQEPRMNLFSCCTSGDKMVCMWHLIFKFSGASLESEVVLLYCTVLHIHNSLMMSDMHNCQV